MLISVFASCEPIDATTANGGSSTQNPTGTTIPDEIVKKPLSISCVAGTPGCYTFDGTTLKFTNVSADSIYVISGTLEGNIVIDTGDSHKFDLEMHGFTLISKNTTPILVQSGDEVSLKAKKGYENFIYDNRESIDANTGTQSSYAVYSEVDLEFAGKGELEIVSKNNCGIYTKDDLQVKNLSLTVFCTDNALKGNDGVEITNATTRLIATEGDCIKTSNSHINANTGNQKGTVYIAGGTHHLESACDGIDSSYDVLIENSVEAKTVLNIYTNKYSEFANKNIPFTSAKGIKAANSITIKSGNVNIMSFDDGISAKNDGGLLENGNAPLGDVTISGGTVTIKSNNKGINADGKLDITTDSLNIEEFCQ
jgi:hypothetical protein